MKLGYYTVDSVVYSDKIQALYAATKSKSQVFWHWHNEYDALDWTQDSVYTLNEVYRRRAQQLRDSYDWLILSFSGGSDSYTVLRSFLDNNIHLDEVFVRWPMSATKNLYIPDSTNLDPANTLTEWDFTIKPMLDTLKKDFPKTKITLYDCSNDILGTNFTDDLLVTTGDRFNPGYWGKFGSIGDNEKKLLDLGRRVCMIFGVDKPQMCIKEGKVYCYFLDILINSSQARSLEYNRITEPFFWSPDCPEVTHTQARLIYQHLKINPTLSKLIDWSLPFQMERKISWDMAVRRVVYPDYNPSWFQASKEANSVNSRQDIYMWQPENQQQMDTWKNVVSNILNSIDSKYINFNQTIPTGLGGFTSKFYLLGDLSTQG